MQVQTREDQVESSSSDSRKRQRLAWILVVAEEAVRNRSDVGKYESQARSTGFIQGSDADY